MKWTPPLDVDSKRPCALFGRPRLWLEKLEYLGGTPPEGGSFAPNAPAPSRPPILSDEQQKVTAQRVRIFLKDSTGSTTAATAYRGPPPASPNDDKVDAVPVGIKIKVAHEHNCACCKNKIERAEGSTRSLGPGDPSNVGDMGALKHPGTLIADKPPIASVPTQPRSTHKSATFRQVCPLTHALSSLKPGWVRLVLPSSAAITLSKVVWVAA